LNGIPARCPNRPSICRNHAVVTGPPRSDTKTCGLEGFLRSVAVTLAIQRWRWDRMQFGALEAARVHHAAPPGTGVSSWRLFSEELPIADIPGIMMRLGARHLNVSKRRYCHGYLSQNLHCGVTRDVTRSCLRRLVAARCYAGAFVSTGRYQV